METLKLVNVFVASSTSSLQANVFVKSIVAISTIINAIAIVSAATAAAASVKCNTSTIMFYPSNSSSLSQRC